MREKGLTSDGKARKGGNGERKGEREKKKERESYREVSGKGWEQSRNNKVGKMRMKRRKNWKMGREETEDGGKSEEEEERRETGN